MMITDKENAEFWVISDTHLIADSLHDNGQAFSRMQKTSQGKDLYYQETVLRSFVKMANEKKPAAIVVTGDLTFNGERVSLQKFAQIFNDLTETKLLVVPGNHDIFDGWAREFKGDKQYYAGEISPAIWRYTFNQMYQHANSDSSSLALAVQFNPKYEFFLLDSNYYGKFETTDAPKTPGGIGDQQLAWLEEQLIAATEKGLRPIIFMHHNLYAHNPAVDKNYVLDNADQLRNLCAKYDVKLAFSGHIHAQNILAGQDGIPTTEIVTSSFCSNDQGYGVVKVSNAKISYHRCTFNIKPYLGEQEQMNYTFTHFDEYMKNLQLASIAQDLIESDRNRDNDLELEKEMGRLFSQMNYNFYTGMNHLSADELDKLKQSKAYNNLVVQHPEYRLYLNTLYDTSDHSNWQAEIKY